jgi:HEPN domain-containing protein
MNEDMVKLWLIKADNDLKAGKDEVLTENPATDTICFHMQQCVEKYLKAFLIYKGKEISKTHNMALLLQLCIEVDGDFLQLREIGTDEMTVYAVDMRYPNDFYMPPLDETLKAVHIAELTKSFVVAKLSL